MQGLAARLREDVARQDPFWPAQLTLLVAIALYVTLPGKLTVGPSWVLPAVEAAAFLAVVAATPRPGRRPMQRRRQLALAVIGLVATVNAVSVGLLAHELVKGAAVKGEPLLLAGLAMWATDVLVGGVFFWELDRGGPPERTGAPDFHFPTQDEPEHSRWKPAFVDYLYIGLTNAIAFSPTDAMPLTRRAKAGMAVHSLAAFVTIGLVLARAVNVLA